MLEAIEVENFRCIRHESLQLDPAATLICGENGAGKTSLLEAIFFVSHGRSFRTTVREQLLAKDAQFLRVIARVQSPLATVLGAEWSDGTTQLRLAGRTARSTAEMAQALPVQVIDPAVHRVIEEGSSRRRRLLDWGVFHVKHEFMPAWQRYQRGLQQRNASLRSGRPLAEVTAWDGELTAAAGVMDAARRSYLESLLPYFKALSQQFLGERAAVNFYAGWPADAALADALTDSRERDLRVRFTSVGAHRADLRFKLDGRLARDRASRGEQKLLAMTFILAQIQCLAATGSARPTLLLDDPAAELDVDNLGKLLRVVVQLPCQLIATTVSQQSLQSLQFGRMFHVKQGQFHAML